MSEEMEMIAKTVIMCNHSDADSVMASLVMGAAAAATGEKVFMFFQPGGAKVLVKGELEKFKGIQGLPDPLYLYESILTLEGEFILCELGIPNKGLKREDLREEVCVMMASEFLMKADGAHFCFSY